MLLLNLRDESAAGANLTAANHAIFLHPLLVQTQQEYDACDTQAVGAALTRTLALALTRTLTRTRTLTLPLTPTLTRCGGQQRAGGRPSLLRRLYLRRGAHLPVR